MVNTDIIPNLKASTVAIGIIDESNPMFPLAIGGTGFFISEDGFFVTASHVLDDLDCLLKDRFAENKNAKVMIIQNVVRETGKIGKIDVKVFQILKIIHLKASTSSSYQSSLNLDISVGRVYGDIHNLEHLKLKRAILQVYDEVFMCGFPKGTFMVKQNSLGTTRTSPALQTGRISTIFPYDGTIEPEGIQTDIVGTGGSSGSPIVDANDGTVIAIAQNVLGVSVTKKEIINDGKTTKWARSYVGDGNTGLTFGITMFFVHDPILQLVNIMKSEFYQNGNIKPEFAKPHKSSEYKF
ncbi:S1 family peptidase [Candidatus Nitrosotenuis aquarius]|uniref:S1 family peptidase n=1 Tax=Candidatus Nitrosotenuis aquarius TaxID=1846278 RepID=UPI000C1EE528|nr:serine protease [Candidatus Nitrosotenuis aquarius]